MPERKLLRRKGIKWEYNGDGQFAKEWIPPFWKRYWKRWRRRLWKDEAAEQAHEADAQCVGIGNDLEQVDNLE
jgi:hypothetical protein